MTEESTPKARVPPRWFERAFWAVHRRVVRWSGGRVGLWRPKPGGWGTLQLHAVGRRSGKPRPVIVGYLDDGDDVVTMAMNGWYPGEPAWWQNLRAHPEVRIDLKDGPRDVTAHEAEGDERDRLWARWKEIHPELDDFAARRPERTAVVVLSPRTPG